MILVGKVIISTSLGNQVKKNHFPKILKQGSTGTFKEHGDILLIAQIGKDFNCTHQIFEIQNL